MAKTTISVDTTVRDRLAVLANRHARPLGEQLAVLLDVAEANEFWDEVAVGYAHSADTGAETEEFPEYRHLGSGRQLATPADMRDDVPPTVADRSVA